MKLTKKVVVAAIEEVHDKIGFKPAIDTKANLAELEKIFHQNILDIELEDDEREDFTEETNQVIDALAEKFPDMEAREDDDGIEDVTPVEEEEEEVKEKPKKKGKKAASKEIDPLELAEEIKTTKKISRDELYAIVQDNPDLFGENADTLLTITNPMVLKKQMRNVLEGGKIEMVATRKPGAAKAAAPKAAKKEKAPKKVAKTISEQVEEIDDLDELKSFANDNKDSFPGVKVKKFDKVNKLRKALLKVVVVPKKTPKTKGGRSLEEVRAERNEQIAWITEYLNEQGGKVGRKKLTAKAIDQFPKAAKHVRDLISYAKNPKYNKFEKLMVEVDGVIGWEDVMNAETKKSAKKAEAKAPKADSKAKGKGKGKKKKGKK